MSDAAAKQPVYSGQIRHAMDNKHRVTLPSKWRRDGGVEEFYLLPDQSRDFLNVLPPPEFYRLNAKLMNDPEISEVQKRQVNRLYFSQAQTCTLDAQHRLLIPDEFCRMVGLDTELVLVGAVARIEIWDPQRWQRLAEGDEAVSCREIINRIGG